MACPVCLSTEVASTFTAREMQLNLREEFEYSECALCGSLRLDEVPGDLGRYYPADYHAYARVRGPSHRRPLLRRFWTRWLVSSKSAAAAWLARSLAARRAPFFLWAQSCGVSTDADILDVGCGSGGLLRRMQRYGFSNLTGIDPYAPEEFEEPGFRIARADLDRSTGTFDLVMMHHVLEHLPDPARALSLASERLRPGGALLVRIPLAGSYAARHFKADWFNLDAPRHLVIPTEAGMQTLAQRCGLRLMETGFDPAEKSVELSVHYRNGIPWKDVPEPTRQERRRYRRLSQRLNRSREGDLGRFILRKPPLARTG